MRVQLILTLAIILSKSDFCSSLNGAISDTNFMRRFIFLDPREVFYLDIYETVPKLYDFGPVEINHYVDNLLVHLRNAIVQYDLDPLSLEPYDSTFKFHVGLIVFIGQLRLDNSTLYNLSNVTRKGDSLAKFENNTITFSTQLEFDLLQMDGVYTVKVINIGKIGEVVATVKNLTVLIDVSFNAENFTGHLNDLRITSDGWIDVDLKGNILDDLGTVLARVIANLFKNQILRSLEASAREQIDEILSRVHL